MSVGDRPDKGFWISYHQLIVGAGLGTKVSYSPISEQQNPPFLTDE